MKRLVTLAAGLITLTASTFASANLKVVDLTPIVGATDTSCAVQVDPKEIVDNMYKGPDEALNVDTVKITDLQVLKLAGVTLDATKSILFASDDFVTEFGIPKDVPLTGAQCKLLVAGAILSFTGSFGTEAGTLTLPQEFSLNSAVKAGIYLSLLNSGITIRSLTTQKAIGKADGTTPPGSTPPGTPGSTPGATPGSTPGSTSPSTTTEKSDCTIASAPGANAGAGGFFALALAGLVCAGRRRGRR